MKTYIEDRIKELEYLISDDDSGLWKRVYELEQAVAESSAPPNMEDKGENKMKELTYEERLIRLEQLVKALSYCCDVSLDYSSEPELGERINMPKKEQL